MHSSSSPVLTNRRIATFLIGIGALLVLLLAYGAPTSAAPRNQTVPVPTATRPEPTPPPATPTPRPDNGDNDDGQPAEDPNNNLPSAGGEASQPVAGLTGFVNAATLNVRAGAGDDFPVVGQLKAGESVSVLAQNAAGTWWQICCVTPDGATGWAAARFITPNFDPTGSVPPVSADADLPVGQVGVQAAVAGAEQSLALTVVQDPPYVRQNELVEMRMVVTNSGAEVVQNVELRGNIADGLTYVAASAGGAGATVEAESGTASLFELHWPELKAGSSVTGTVVLQVGMGLSNGSVIDNTIAANADNTTSTSDSIRVGLPPAVLPDFK